MPTVYSPPVSTYTALSTVTLTSTDAEVLFENIPNTYRDLILTFVATGAADENLTPKINGSSADFSWIQITSGPSSGTGTNNSIGRVGGSSQTMGFLQFFDYAETDKHKSFMVRTNVAGTESRELIARWAQTTAINSISLGIRLGSSFQIGSTFSLYGIKA